MLRQASCIELSFAYLLHKTCLIMFSSDLRWYEPCLIIYLQFAIIFVLRSYVWPILFEILTLPSKVIWIAIMLCFVALAAYSDVKKSEYKEDGIPVDIKLPVKHVLSRELQVYYFPCSVSTLRKILWNAIISLWLPLQLYFEKITELTRRSSSTLFKEALASLATDSGLHALVPYFTCFVADEVVILMVSWSNYFLLRIFRDVFLQSSQVTRNLNSFPLLFALMRLVRSLLQNPHIHIEPYVSI